MKAVAFVALLALCAAVAVSATTVITFDMPTGADQAVYMPQNNVGCSLCIQLLDQGCVAVRPAHRRGGGPLRPTGAARGPGECGRRKRSV